MLSSWPASLDFVWQERCDGQGLHCTPGDPGGTTNMGVTWATWSTAVAQGIVTGNLIYASRDQLALVLHTMFWKVVSGDVLPAGVDLAVFNFGMVAGPGRALQWLQRTVGTAPDGIVGPHTLAAVNGMAVVDLIAGFTSNEEGYYRSLPGAPQFDKGWEWRAEAAKAAALSLAGAGPAIA